MGGNTPRDEGGAHELGGRSREGGNMVTAGILARCERNVLVSRVRGAGT